MPESRNFKEDTETKGMEAFRSNNQSTTYADARGVLGHSSTLWW